MTHQKIKLPSWAFVLLIYLGCLALLEMVGQIAIYYFETKRPSGLFGEEILSHAEPVLGFALKKRLNRSMGQWSVMTNELGFREEHSVPLQKPESEYRVFVVGGSTVFGWGVNAQEAIPQKLQELVLKKFSRRLASEGRSVRIINTGVPWYASWHEAALVYFRLLELEPDQIIILDGLNDTADAMAPSWTPLVQGYVDLPTRIAYEKRKAGAKLSNVFIEFLKLSPSFRYFHAKWKAHEQLEQGDPHPEVWDQYIHYMQRLATLAQKNGIRFDIFYQPVMVVDKSLDPFEIQTNGTSMKKEVFAQKFRKLYLEGERRIASTALPFHSLRSLFRTVHEIMYFDGLHYTPKGNALIAQAIFDQTLSSGLGPSLKKTPKS